MFQLYDLLFCKKENANMQCTRWLAAVITCVALWATAAAATPLEPLLGISTDLDRKEITFEVVASGCTKKEDFRFEYTNHVLTVIRLRPDSCKAMPQKIDLTFKLAEVGIDPYIPFTIANPFLVNEHIAHTRLP